MRHLTLTKNGWLSQYKGKEWTKILNALLLLADEYEYVFRIAGQRDGKQ
jgi:hypothetical protein